MEIGGPGVSTPWRSEAMEISDFRRKKSKTFRLRTVSSPDMESGLQVPHGRFSKVAYVTSLTAFPKSDIFGVPPLQALKLDPCSTVCCRTTGYPTGKFLFRPGSTENCCSAFGNFMPQPQSIFQTRCRALSFFPD